MLYFKFASVAALGDVCTALIYGLIAMLLPASNLLNLLIATVVSLIVPNVLFILIFYRTEEFKYFKNIALSKLKR